MCTIPSVPGAISTKAPNLVMLTTFPVIMSPTFTSTGSAFTGSLYSDGFNAAFLDNLIFPALSILITLTVTLSPTLTTSSTLSTLLSSNSLMWTIPSVPGKSVTNAPNEATFATFPVKTSPTWISRVRSLIIEIALFALSASEDPMSIVPSSSISTVAPVSSTILRIIFPPGPITVPILSTGTWTFWILGAWGLTSWRTSGIAVSITFNIWDLASFAWAKVSLITEKLMLLTLISNCMAVIPFEVPATLKSMSPTWSSSPWISVSVT